MRQHLTKLFLLLLVLGLPGLLRAEEGKQQREDVVLVLGRIHSTSQLIAALPERAVEL